MTAQPRSGGVYAGYVAAVPGNGSGSEQFTVPLLPCGSSRFESGVYIGVFANQSGDVTSYPLEASVTAQCFDGAESAVSLLSGCGPGPAGCAQISDVGEKTLTVRPGDVVVALLRVSRASSAMTVTDLNDHKTVSLPGGGGKLMHVLDGMVLSYRAEGTPMGLPDFGQLRFTHAAIDDQNLLAAKATALYMSYPIFARTTTGPLAPTGNAWTETYQQPSPSA